MLLILSFICIFLLAAVYMLSRESSPDKTFIEPGPVLEDSQRALIPAETSVQKVDNASKLANYSPDTVETISGDASGSIAITPKAASQTTHGSSNSGDSSTSAEIQSLYQHNKVTDAEISRNSKELTRQTAEPPGQTESIIANAGNMLPPQTGLEEKAADDQLLPALMASELLYRDLPFILEKSVRSRMIP